jgi:hypothetical protein
MRKVYPCNMKSVHPDSRRWVDPVKGKPASEETLNTRGNFADFTEAMKKLMKVKPEKKSASPGPVSS